MRQAIVTKYLGPTNTRGARIKATCEAGSITVPYGYNNVEDEHTKAAVALAFKLGWDTSTMHGGGLDNGYCFVFVERPALHGPLSGTPESDMIGSLG